MLGPAGGPVVRLVLQAPPARHAAPHSGLPPACSVRCRRAAPRGTVTCRDRKLNGQSTDQLSRSGGGGGTISHNGGGGGGGGGQDGGGSGGGDEDDPNHTRRALAVEMIKWLAAAVAAAAALLAALPSALSHPLGLQATLAMVNLALPGTASLQLDSLDLSWQRPLRLTGLRLVERSSTGGGSGSRTGGSGSRAQDGQTADDSAPFDPSSSDDDDDDDDDEEEEEEKDVLLPSLHAAGAGAAGAATAAAQSASGHQRHQRGGGSSGAGPAAAAESPGGSSTGGGPARGGKRRRTLVSVDQVSVVQTLWQLVRGNPVEVVVTRPQVDCTLNASGKPRLVALLEAAGMLPQAYPAPPPGKAGSAGSSAAGATGRAAAAAATVALAAPSAPRPGGGGKAGAAGGGAAPAGPQQGQQAPRQQAQQQQEAQGGADTAAAAQAQGGRGRGRLPLPRLSGKPRQHAEDSSDSEDEEAPSLAQAAAEAALRNAGGASTKAAPASPLGLLGYMYPGVTGPAQKPQQKQQQAEGGGDGSAGGSGAAGNSTGADTGSTSAGTAAVGSTGGGTGGGSGSTSWLPDSLQHVGGAITLTAEVTAGKLTLCVADGALLVPAEFRELLGKHIHFEVLQGLAAIEQAAKDEEPAPAAAATPGSKGSSSKNGGGGGGGGDASGSGAASSSVRKRLKWARQRPAVLLPWGTGMPQTPVAIRLDSQLMRFKLEGWQTGRGFTYLHRPVEASLVFTPALSKYLLTLAHPALGGAVGLRGSTRVQASLAPHQGLLPARQATLRVEPLSVEVNEAPVLRQTVGLLGEAVGKLKLGGSIKAELSPIQATLNADGQLRAERLDIRVKTGLGPWKQGLHLVSWGGASLRPPESLDATLCVPGDALKGLGLPEFSDGSGLGLHISGTPTQPKVEIAKASRDLALLLASHQASSLVKSKGGPQWLADQLGSLGGGAQARGVQMPPPLA